MPFSVRRVSQATKVQSPDKKSFRTSTITTGDENGRPPYGYCPARWFVEPAPPGEDKMTSLDHK